MTTQFFPSSAETGLESKATKLTPEIRALLGDQLRTLYGNPSEEKLPSELTTLIERLEAAIRSRGGPFDRAFADEILSYAQSLRSFAVSLTRNVEQAEDLLQETILKALSNQDRFMPGSNLRAWLFTILRNLFHSSYRKSRREVEDPQGAHADTLITIPDQMAKLDMQDFEAALAKIPRDQREALMLVGAEGLTYEEVAQVLGVKVGTIKSRVNRARNQLAELLGIDRTDDIGGSRLQRA
ncbi:sigma-70 family RNA polymerase sigma factor [Microvirga massiliensis]|uniref:sigma-70 family RNA polymerase sigma factor n=1 Tax=Microvirga massiliensis TaxID=1033741 RepID=UPI00062BCF6F|nr:sigma-70 family RNA polymerase sigma factor [Microvirga massiliensis]